MGDVASASSGVFISYASRDLDAAHQIRVHLEAGGIRCWMAPDDVGGSTGWAGQIADAIAACPAMIVLLSTSSVDSSHVAREAELAVGKGKQLIPVRLVDVVPSGPLEYLLAQAQWIDAFPGPLEQNVEALRSRIARVLAAAEPVTTAPPAGRTAAPPPRVRSPRLVRPRSGARIAARILVFLIAVAVAVFSAVSFLRAETGLPPAPLQPARNLWIEPNPTTPASAVWAEGSDWAPGSPVDVQWGEPYGALVGWGSADASGGFSIPFVVPAGTAPGTYSIYACQYAAGTSCFPGNEFQAIASTTVTVVAADSPPVAASDAYSMAMDVPLVIHDAGLTANDHDPDGDPLCSTVAVVSGPGRGYLERIDDATLRYTPWGGVLGSDSFSYRVCDTVHGALSNTAQVTIDVRFVGAITLSPSSGRPGTSVTVTGSRFPVDAPVDVLWGQAPVTSTSVGSGNGFSASFIVDDAAPGSYPVSACVAGTGYCASATFQVTAPPPPPPPAGTTSTTSTTSATTTTTTTAPLTTTTTTRAPATGDPEPPATSTTTSTTAPPTTTTSSSTTQAPDGTTTVAPSDDGTGRPPVVRSDEAVTGPGDRVSVDLSANDEDPDGDLDPGTIEITAPPSHGMAMLTSPPGWVVYEPEPGFSGRDEFVYAVCDLRGACDSAVVTVYVEGRCDPDGMRLVDADLTPDDGPPGSRTRLHVDVAEACRGTTLAVLWDGQEWAGPFPITDGGIETPLWIPEDATHGPHTVEVVTTGTTAVLARLPYTIRAPATIGGDEGSGRWWWWIPLAAGVAAAAAAFRTGRLGAWSRRRRVTRLAARAARLASALEECEARSAGRLGILPTFVESKEGAGGSDPYLLAFENPAAPEQEDGRRGWYHPRRKEPIRGVVVHTTEGLGLAGEEAPRVARYFATCREPASAHAVADAGGVITLLPDGYTALHVPAANSASLGLVVCLTSDPGQQSRAIRHAARWIRAKAAEHGFTVGHIDADAWRIGESGVLGHHDLEAGTPDPVVPNGAGGFPWEEVLDPQAGPSTFPSAVPFRTGRRGDPCAAVRRRAAHARASAERAAERANSGRR